MEKGEKIEEEEKKQRGEMMLRGGREGKSGRIWCKISNLSKNATEGGKKKHSA